MLIVSTEYFSFCSTFITKALGFEEKAGISSEMKSSVCGRIKELKAGPT